MLRHASIIKFKLNMTNIDLRPWYLFILANSNKLQKKCLSHAHPGAAYELSEVTSETSIKKACVAEAFEPQNRFEPQHKDAVV